MPNKCEFDMERNMVMCVDEIQRLRAENDTLRKESEFYRKQCDMRDEWRDKDEAELAALREAARPVVEDWTEYRMIRVDPMSGEEIGNVDATPEQLDALAALVGEG